MCVTNDTYIFVVILMIMDDWRASTCLITHAAVIAVMLIPFPAVGTASMCTAFCFSQLCTAILTDSISPIIAALAHFDIIETLVAFFAEMLVIVRVFYTHAVAAFCYLLTAVHTQAAIFACIHVIKTCGALFTEMLIPAAALNTVIAAAAAGIYCVLNTAFHTQAAIFAEIQLKALGTFFTLRAGKFCCTVYTMSAFSAGSTPFLHMDPAGLTMCALIYCTLIAHIALIAHLTFITPLADTTMRAAVQRTVPAFFAEKTELTRILSKTFAAFHTCWRTLNTMSFRVISKRMDSAWVQIHSAFHAELTVISFLQSTIYTVIALLTDVSKMFPAFNTMIFLIGPRTFFTKSAIFTQFVIFKRLPAFFAVMCLVAVTGIGALRAVRAIVTQPVIKTISTAVFTLGAILITGMHLYRQKTDYQNQTQ